jgi:hypothetical protein
MAPDKDSKKKKHRDDEGPVDLAARVGSRGAPSEPTSVPPELSPSEPSLPQQLDEALPPSRTADRPLTIGGDEPPPPPIAPPPSPDEEQKSAPIVSVRGAPSLGEVDLVVTPLPTPDDWHRFELALRKVRGVTQLRPEYYRHGVAKMRVSYEGTERLATTLRAGVPGYRVRVIGEDRATIQILVSSETEERRPG